MKFRNFLIYILCILMLVLSCFVTSYASEKDGIRSPYIINVFEEFSGIIINGFAKLFKANTDENDIPAATVNPHSWIEYNGEPIENPEQTLTAETWVANEIVFAIPTEKAYKI